MTQKQENIERLIVFAVDIVFECGPPFKSKEKENHKKYSQVQKEVIKCGLPLV